MGSLLPPSKPDGTPSACAMSFAWSTNRPGTQGAQAAAQAAAQAGAGQSCVVSVPVPRWGPDHRDNFHCRGRFYAAPLCSAQGLRDPVQTPPAHEAARLCPAQPSESLTVRLGAALGNFEPRLVVVVVVVGDVEHRVCEAELQRRHLDLK